MPLPWTAPISHNRLAMDLFNSFSRLPYSTAYEGRHGINGSYVEVWTEGRYSGLYCLTDRVNRKLLGGKKMKGVASREQSGTRSDFAEAQPALGGAKGGALRGIVYKCKSYDKGCYFMSDGTEPVEGSVSWNA